MVPAHRPARRLCSIAVLSASLALGMVVSASHAQPAQPVLQPQPGALSIAGTVPGTASQPGREAPVHTPALLLQPPALPATLEPPTTFAGVLPPCAGCPAVAHLLVLHGDGSYRLRGTGLDSATGAPRVRSGRWTTDPNGRRLVLRHAKGHPHAAFSVQPNGTLQALGTESTPVFFSARPVVLHRIGRLPPAAGAASLPLHSLAQAQAQASKAQGTEGMAANRTGPGFGSSAGTETQAAVDRQSSAQLQETYWKLVSLQGQPVSMLPGQEREVRITLVSRHHQVQGFTGCNALGGQYTLDGAALQFHRLASTRKMCSPPANQLERAVLHALRATTGHRIEGEQLVLLLDGQRELARFEAMYLR